MILKWPFHVVHMTAKRARTHAIKPIPVVEQSQILLDVRVPEIVPISNVRFVEALEEILEFALRRHRLVVFAVFDANPDAFLRCIGQDFGQALQCSPRVFSARAFPTLHGLEFDSGKLLAEKSPFVHQSAQARGQL